MGRLQKARSRYPSRSPWIAAAWTRRLALLLPLLAPIAACTTQAPRAPGFAPLAYTPPPTAETSRVRVGLLLPLSGANAPLGQAMLHAAEMALFEQADPRLEFLPRDTGGSSSGAATAARTALQDGARAIAGPLTLGETNAAAQVARGRAPVIAFTSDPNQAGQGVWVLGVTPAQQVRRMVAAATAAGLQRIGLMAQDDEFGRRMGQALQAAASELSLPPPVVILRPVGSDAAGAIRDLSNRAGTAGLDAVILGDAGPRARAAASAIAAAFPRPPRILGNYLWSQDNSLNEEAALNGALFPGPDPSARAQFDSRYQAAFGERPPRLAGIAYDAAALAARAARDPSGQLPVGEAFMGADGPLRVLPGGLMGRGLAVFAIQPAQEPRLVEPAPVPGTAGS